MLGEIKLAANNDREPTSVSLVWIAISYVFAGLVSIASFTEMCYVLANFENSSRHTQAEITKIVFMCMAGMLCLVTIAMSIRLCRLRHLNVPINDGRNTLLNCYLLFTVGYILRSVNDYFLAESNDQTFIVEIMFDISSLSNDAIPILCMLIFHFQNFKPNQHELIIRMAQHEVSSTKEMEMDTGMELITDGMFN